MQLCGARRKYLRAVHLGDASARLAPFDRWRDLLVGEPHRLEGSLHHRLTIGDGASKVELGSAADALVSRARLREGGGAVSLGQSVEPCVHSLVNERRRDLRVGELLV